MIRIHHRRECRKCGIILTCYVDGRKRFRSVAIAHDSATASFHGAPAPAETSALPSHGTSSPRRGH